LKWSVHRGLHVPVELYAMAAALLTARLDNTKSLQPLGTPVSLPEGVHESDILTESILAVDEDFLSIDAKKGWSQRRLKLYDIVRSTTFQAVFQILLCVNLVFVVIKTDIMAYKKHLAGWMQAADRGILLTFAVELGIRIFVYRSAFWAQIWNVSDFVLVCLDFIAEAIDIIIAAATDRGVDVVSLTMLRIFRLFRLSRGIRMLSTFPELALIVKGTFGAIKVVIWGTLLIFVTLLLWGVVAVQIIHPLNTKLADSGMYDGSCERCKRAYSSVIQSILTLCQQIIAGDSWGQVSVPIIEAYPFSSIFFVAVFVTVNIAILNVILAVIVDSALKASQDDIHQLALLKEKEFALQAVKLRSICREMDVDKSGTITLPELSKGYDDNMDFQDTLTVMGLCKADLSMVFEVLDKDGSGDVSYDEFVDELYKLKTHDQHTLLVFIKFYVMEIKRKVEDEMKVIRSHVSEAAVDIAQSQKLSELQEVKPMKLPSSLFANAKIDVTQEDGEKDLIHANVAKELRVEVDRLHGITEDLTRRIGDLMQNTDRQSSMVDCLVDSLPVLLGNPVLPEKLELPQAPLCQPHRLSKSRDRPSHGFAFQRVTPAQAPHEPVQAPVPNSVGPMHMCCQARCGHLPPNRVKT